MNRDLIIVNEARNDGKSVFFYPVASSTEWVAYGFSAYLLSKLDGVKPLVGFAVEMQMPCACITEDDFVQLARKNQDKIQSVDEYYLLPTDEAVADDAYREWVAELK